MRTTCVFVLAACCALDVSARGQCSVFGPQVIHAVTAGPVPIGGQVQAALPQFDPSLGHLNFVCIQVRVNLSGTYGIENTTARSFTFGGPGAVFTGAYANPWSVGPVNSLGSGSASGAWGPASTTLAAFDGAADFGGTSGVTLPLGATDGNAPNVPVYHLPFLDALTGTGTVPCAAGPMTWMNPMFGWPPPGIVVSPNLQVSVEFQVRYGYTPFPAPLCVGGLASPPCPCSNLPAGGGGCDNSVGSGGGLLAVSGSASLSNDTLTLAGTGMTNSSALYVQGSSYQHAPLVYGDGVRCVTGTLVRLGTRTNAGGASQLPSAGGTPISVLGAVTAPGTRGYQVVYRDNGNFCTPSTFNATNGQAILWSL